MRAQRAGEDVTAIVMTVVETRDDVKELKGDVGEFKREVHRLTRAVQAMLGDQGLAVRP